MLKDLDFQYEGNSTVYEMFREMVVAAVMHDSYMIHDHRCDGDCEAYSFSIIPFEYEDDVTAEDGTIEIVRKRIGHQTITIRKKV